jgi:hypothetical protein
VRRVSQKRLVEVDEHGIRVEGSAGDCFPACIASIFELPLELAPGMGGNTQALYDWLALNYSGIGCASRSWLEPKQTLNNGFWIATVISPRFREPVCHNCSPERAASEPPFFWRRDECPYCDATGHQRGLHAVVMEHGRLAWDPHPQADYSEPQVVGETVFVVTDPARLPARTIPRL